MSIQRTHTTVPRVTASSYDISQWTDKGNNRKLYASLANNSDSGMMKADSIMFDPKEMLTSGVSHKTNDPSYQRVMMSQQLPVLYYVGGILLFLVTLKYLTTNQ